ncbi:MAG: hypothetical protein Q9170_007767, partial [Blastenia crenularia]
MEDVAYPEIVNEKAVLHRNLRNFSKAAVIFENYPPSVAVQAPIVLEHTWTLIAQYRFKEARSIAVRGLSSLSNKSSRIEGFGPTILIRALLAGLDALIEGSVSGCVKSLREIHDWLVNVPVWAVNVYYYLPNLLNEPTSQIDIQDIPSTPLNSPSSGITLLRTHLQRVGRLNEALFLLDTEISLLPNKDAEIQAMESLRSACLEPSTQPVTYIQGTIALKLSLIYASLADSESYSEELFNAAAALSAPKDSMFHSNLLRTDTWLARLELSRATEGEEGPGAEAWEKFADYAAQ